MDYLKNLNSDERDDQVFLEEETHTYFINGKSGYLSVTTFVKSLYEEFNSDLIIKNMMKSKNWINSKYFGMEPDDIKKLWNDKGNLAAREGTKLHLDIEKYYNFVKYENDSREFKHFLKFTEKFCHLIPLRTEKIIYSRDLKLAGSIDMLFLNPKDNTIQIYDWKRIKEISKVNKYNKWMLNKNISYLPDSNYWHYAIQLNVYKYIYNREYSGQVTSMNLVSLHAENNSFIHIPVIDLQDEIEILMNERLLNEC